MHLKRDEWTDTAPLIELSKAIAFISNLSKNLGLNHTTEVNHFYLSFLHVLSLLLKCCFS